MRKRNPLAFLKDDEARSTEDATKSDEKHESKVVVIIGGGGHGLATAFYLAKEHGHYKPCAKELDALIERLVGDDFTYKSKANRAHTKLVVTTLEPRQKLYIWLRQFKQRK